MPYSESIFDDKVRELLGEWNYLNYLDIGVGAGKYGDLIRSTVPKAKIIGIEVDAEYIKKFELDKKYDEIINEDVVSIIFSKPDLTTEVCILGDVLEHLLKSQGSDLINFLVYRTKKILVIYPKKYLQYDVYGKTHEAHRSVWGKDDFSSFGAIHLESGFMCMDIIDGYIDNPEAINKQNG